MRTGQFRAFRNIGVSGCNAAAGRRFCRHLYGAAFHAASRTFRRGLLCRCFLCHCFLPGGAFAPARGTFAPVRCPGSDRCPGSGADGPGSPEEVHLS